MEAHDTQRRDIYRRYAPFYNIGSGLGLIVIGIWIGSLVFGSGYFTNVYTEALSVIATIAVLDRLNDWREMRRRKSRLAREAYSRDNSTALNAVDWLRAEKWLCLEDPEHLLSGTKMSRANLENAYLYGADLQAVNLYKANLSKADLSKSDLRNAYLYRANLSYASLYGTDLRGACLWGANLRQVNHLDATIFDETTILPDANPLKDEHGQTRYDDAGKVIFDKHWSPDVDMNRYTDPQHPQYWYVR
ncbi:MAG: pentapeptide repeat-containing protein [Chloroflexota bacterium]